MIELQLHEPVVYHRYNRYRRRCDNPHRNWLNIRDKALWEQHEREELRRELEQKHKQTP